MTVAPRLLSEVVWDAYPLNAEVRALVVFQQADRPGMLVLARVVSDDIVYGVREIDMASQGAARVLDAWRREAESEGWPVIDMTAPSGGMQ